ncbi:MAG: SsrA-binding protein SmpB [Lachnospiraceae bacterium]|nr:SsrA-binding protein SmpB [Lachnospiraceae bacterium]
MGKDSVKLIANNKKAYYDYFVEDEYEAGIVLVGTEVKSLRMGQCSVKEAYISVHSGELFVRNMHISPYEKGNIFNRDPLRERKLLLNKAEIRKLTGISSQPGYTLIPLQVYLKGNYVKVKVGVCRGKKLYDKRDTIAKKDQKRELEKQFKQSQLRV